MIRAGEFIKDEQVYISKNLVSNPDISVILPTFCRGDDGLLEKSINSVLKQTFLNFELIIVDDGSKDSTRSIVETLLEKDNRIVYIRNEKNSGLPALRCNQAFLHARGKYICFQFDDDTWREDALSELYKAIENCSDELHIVYGASMIHDLNTGAVYKFFEKYNYNNLLIQNRIANNSVIIPRQVIDLYGLYDCSLLMRRLCDWDLWVRYAKHISFKAIDSIISDVTLYAENSLGNTCDYDQNVTRLIMNFNRTKELLPQNIKEYIVDKIPACFYEREQNQILNRHIYPWYIKHSEYDNNPVLSNGSRFKNRIIIAKYAYDSTVEIMITNFLELLQEEFFFAYIPEEQIDTFEFGENDILFLCRATRRETLTFLESRPDLPVAYFIDDDLFNIYKLGLDYIAPGTEMYSTVEKLISRADVVVPFSDLIATNVKHYNKKIIQMKTNILSRYVLPKQKTKSDTFRIFFAGGTARSNEFAKISSDLIELSEIYKDKISFEFWGYMPTELKNLKISQVKYCPFNDNYHEYIEKLSKNEFDLFLCPLDNSEFNRGKSPIKLLESQACGAIGLFSDMPVYKEIVDGVNGFLIKDGDSWKDKIIGIIDMDYEEREKIFLEANRYVREKYITEVMLLDFQRIIQQVQLANYIGKDGSILFASHSHHYAGAESVLYKHSLLMRDAGFDVIFCFPSSCEYANGQLQKMLGENGIRIEYLNYHNYTDIEEIDKDKTYALKDTIKDFLLKNNVRLVHNCTLIPSISAACHEVGIPNVANLYASRFDRMAFLDKFFLPDYICSDAFGTLANWVSKTNLPGKCIRNYIPNNMPTKSDSTNNFKVAVVGSIQPRKNQLTAIKVINNLVNKGIDVELFIYGYDEFYSSYLEECKDFISKNDISDLVHIKGFSDRVMDELLENNIDALMCASDCESLPQSILEAAMLKIPIVTTPVGYVTEVINENTGFVSKGFNVEDIEESVLKCLAAYQNSSILEITKNAHDFVEENCSLDVVQRKVIEMYQEAILFDKIACTSIGKKIEGETHDSSFPAKCYVRKVIDSSRLKVSPEIENALTYRFIADKDKFSVIALIFTSFQDYQADGVVSIKLIYKGNVIREAYNNLLTIVNNEWCDFSFEELSNCKDKQFDLVISFNCKDGSKKYCVYENLKNLSRVKKIAKKVGLSRCDSDELLIDLL